MKHVREVLLGLIASAVLLGFGAGIFAAGYYSLWITGAPRPDQMPSIVAYFVSAVNGTLAANLGAVLGISAVTRDWHGPGTKTELFQWIAACWYVVMLLVAGALWGRTGFTEAEMSVVPTLPELSKSGLGISIAVLAAVLGVKAVREAKSV